ncbi:MAG: aminotransferase class III-fold pyridoxal phosphate-dependent enzyme [Planctomycetota bacterium]|nr:aminotransferase class III-fold pyridoxal phosphate-dependent enzyme [Planctomycetota bacterium]
MSDRLKTHISGRLNDRFYRLCITENFPFVLDIGKSRGMYLRSVEGQNIFDWAGYYGSKLIAHNHPGLYEKKYLRRLAVAANNKVPNPDFLTRECLEFYETAFAMAPMAMRSSPELEIYAVNSGAEVVENMLKYLISRFNSRVGLADRLSRRRFIVFENSFHGRTVFALSMTNVPAPVAIKDFHPLFRSALPVPFPAVVFSGFDPEAMRRYNSAATERSLSSIESLLKRHAGTVVGIIVEPIQSAGGHNVALPSFFEELSRLARDHGAYLGFDEVQTGMGGTGKPFYVDHLRLAAPPQALVVAKKFGVGVLYMLDHLRDVGVLDSTWGGPLVDMVRFMREIEIVRRERLMDRAADVGRFLLRGLAELESRYPDCIVNPRGVGTLLGFTVLPAHDRRPRDLLLDIALRKHLLLMLDAGKSSVRLRPCLSATRKDAARFLDLLDRTLRDFRAERPAEMAREAIRQRRMPVSAFMRLALR